MTSTYVDPIAVELLDGTFDFDPECPLVEDMEEALNRAIKVMERIHGTIDGSFDYGSAVDEALRQNELIQGEDPALNKFARMLRDVVRKYAVQADPFWML